MPLFSLRTAAGGEEEQGEQGRGAGPCPGLSVSRGSCSAIAVLSRLLETLSTLRWASARRTEDCGRRNRRLLSAPCPLALTRSPHQLAVKQAGVRLLATKGSPSPSAPTDSPTSASSARASTSGFDASVSRLANPVLTTAARQQPETMASTASATTSSPEARAKALLDEAPGVYALRKRRRDSSNQTADTDSPTASQEPRAHAEATSKSTEAVTPSPTTVKGHANDATAAAISAPPAGQPPSSVTHGQASPAPAPSASTPQAPMASGHEDDDNDDGSGDESDLTSLSELEERLERETIAQLPRRPRRAKDISGRKTPRKRKTAVSAAASSPASSSASTGASEYRPADETDHAGSSSEVEPVLPMDVDAPRPRKGSANPKARKKVSKKPQQASKPRRVAAASKAPPVRRHHSALAPTSQGSQVSAPRAIRPAPATANKVQHMDVVAPSAPPPPPTHAPKRKRALPETTPAQTMLPLVPAREQHDAPPTGEEVCPCS
mgnify:CR=1 FL=1